MVGRSDRQGTCLCCLFWYVDEFGTRPFETEFRLSCLSGATAEELCSCVQWLCGFRYGHALVEGVGRNSGKAFGCPLSKIRGFPSGLVVVVVRPALQGLLSSGLDAMSSIVMNRTGFIKRWLLVVTSRFQPDFPLVAMSSITINRTKHNFLNQITYPFEAAFFVRNGLWVRVLPF